MGHASFVSVVIFEFGATDNFWPFLLAPLAGFRGSFP